MSTFTSSQYTTTTTTTTTSSDHRLYMNSGYIRTEHGYIKILQMVICLLAFICVMSAGYPYNSSPDADFISFVAITGILVSGILLFLYFINAVVFLTSVPWVFIELVYNGLWCFFCFAAGICGAVYASKSSVADVPYAASAFFMFIGMCVYGFYAFKLYLLHQQGVRLVVVSTEITRTSTHASALP